jgi:hypothetical protein
VIRVNMSPEQFGKKCACPGFRQSAGHRFPRHSPSSASEAERHFPAVQSAGRCRW